MTPIMLRGLRQKGKKKEEGGGGLSSYLLASQKEETVFLWKYSVWTFAPNAYNILIWKADLTVSKHSHKEIKQLVILPKCNTKPSISIKQKLLVEIAQNKRIAFLDPCSSFLLSRQDRKKCSAFIGFYLVLCVLGGGKLQSTISPLFKADSQRTNSMKTLFREPIEVHLHANLVRQRDHNFQSQPTGVSTVYIREQ